MCSIPQVTFETLLYVLEKQQVVEFLGEHLFYLLGWRHSYILNFNIVLGCTAALSIIQLSYYFLSFFMCRIKTREYEDIFSEAFAFLESVICSFKHMQYASLLNKHSTVPGT